MHANANETADPSAVRRAPPIHRDGRDAQPGQNGYGESDQALGQYNHTEGPTTKGTTGHEEYESGLGPGPGPKPHKRRTTEYESDLRGPSPPEWGRRRELHVRAIKDPIY